MNYLSATAIASATPPILVSVPYVGETNITPYLVAVGFFVAFVTVCKLLLVGLVGRLKVLSDRTSTDMDDVVIGAVQGIRMWVYGLVGFYLALQLFTLPQWLDVTISVVVYVALTWQVIEFLLCFVRYGAARLIEKDEDGDGVIDPNAATASDLINLIARIVLYVFGAIFILSNLGIEVTSLIAGLGIGGIAVAFALQGVLSDLFASFSIYFDKPFRIGDFIVIGTESGTVEKIGIKTTRLRTLQGEELVVSNAELTTARVQNFKRMQERRGLVQFGVTYDTSQELLAEIPALVEQIFAEISNTRLDRVHLVNFGDSAIIYEVVFFVDSSVYTDFLDAQQTYNLALFRTFADRGIEFAYPTQTLRFDSSDVLSIRSTK